jgi:hypothetical protein
VNSTAPPWLPCAADMDPARHPGSPRSSRPCQLSSLDATQDLTQLQKVVNATANGSAFIDCVDVTNNTHQYGQNNILVG